MFFKPKQTPMQVFIHLPLMIPLFCLHNVVRLFLVKSSIISILLEGVVFPVTILHVSRNVEDAKLIIHFKYKGEISVHLILSIGTQKVILHF